MGARKYIGRLQELPTPFYFYDMDLLRSTLATAVSEASRYGYRIHYALKANFDPRIVETIRQAGLGADCVSGNEVRAAIEAGCPLVMVGHIETPNFAGDGLPADRISSRSTANRPPKWKRSTPSRSEWDAELASRCASIPTSTR